MNNIAAVTNNAIVLIVFVLYLVALLVIGFITQKRYSKSFEDFIAGGKKLGALVTAISASASAESAWVMLGLSGYGYIHGVRAFWAALGCLLGYFINAILILKRLRKESGELGSYTLTEFLAQKSEDEGFLIRSVASIIIVIFFASYVVAQFVGAGKTFNSMEFGPYSLGVVVGGVIVGIYVLLGGYASVCWTDLIQGLIMSFIFLVLPIWGIVKAGGFGGIANSLYGSYMGNPWIDRTGHIVWGFILGELGISLGYIGMPHYVVRYITVKDLKEAKKAVFISYTWGIITFFGSVAIGIISKALIPNLTDPEHALPTFVRLYTHPIIAGITLSAIVAAIMSTADSQLMYGATAVVNDLIKKILEKNGKKLDDKKMVLIVRVLIAIIAIAAIILALLEVQFIYRYVLDYAWSALGASFGSALILSLYYKKFNKWGALTSLLGGSLLVYLWNFARIGKYIKIYNLVPIFFVTLFLSWFVSALTYKKK